LRIVAAIVGLAVVLTLVTVIQFAARGGLTALARSGALGIATFAGWLMILTAGPVAAVQLWRLRRIGLLLTAVLCGFVFAYYIFGLFLFRAPDAPLRPIIQAIVLNGAILALLLSPGARRACS